MIKRQLKQLLSVLNLGLIETAYYRAYRELHGGSASGLAIPITGARIVSKRYINDLNRDMESSIPDKKDLPKTPVLNWKRQEDRTLVKQTALDYRAEISSNEYASAYRSPLRGRMSVARARTWWRLETMRQIRQANPDIFKGKVIEVGAGTGIVSSTLSNFPEVEQMHCLDYDEYTVENLMPLVQHSLDAATTKMTRIAGSYNNMEADDASYDAVVAVGAMHHSEDLAATFLECFRLLKPGGYFIVSDYALTNDMSQHEYSMLMNKPISDEEAQKYFDSGSLDGVCTNKSISEHMRPLFLYQAAAFNSGFNVNTYIFDATTQSGGHLKRIQRYRRTAALGDNLFQQGTAKREHGYDGFGNVRSYSMDSPVYYPVYASHKPPLPLLVALGDRAGKPVYDNVVMLLQKPLGNKETYRYRYKTGKVYDLSSAEFSRSAVY